MPNPNPHEARQAKRRKRRAQPGTLEDARALLWRALTRAGELLEVEDAGHALKAVHAISQGAAAYARIVEVGELEARLSALEDAADEEERGGPRLSRTA
ncbi:hypothetical protein HNQ07_000429 [Deinococcus metalli]|uniref:Uncharacterized protein n=1 Tax=Deinococcus metalli TaxID=1141878 RepID=A0A7W8KBP4_9DEIO|nr:hypothetical protein [Deinococcus metalli]MBB5374985.1 hypothetical protein [Deinococcus metalli]GHF32285.1 hypothetical protein GCM10017781_06140 [Deinococcus metalli]